MTENTSKNTAANPVGFLLAYGLALLCAALFFGARRFAFAATLSVDSLECEEALEALSKLYHAQRAPFSEAPPTEQSIQTFRITRNAASATMGSLLCFKLDNSPIGIYNRSLGWCVMSHRMN